MKKYFLVLLVFTSVLSFAQTQIATPKQGGGFGCNNIRVVQELIIKDDLHNFIVLDADASKLKLEWGKPKTIKLPNTHVKAQIEKLNVERHNYCTDALNPEVQVLGTLPLISGTLKVTKTKTAQKHQFGEPYEINVTIENAVFGKGKKKVKVQKVVLKNMLVNYLMG